MKFNRLFTTAAAICCGLLCAGCAHVGFTETKPDGTKLTFTGFSLLSNSALKGATVNNVTKTTSASLRVTGGTTEPNPEAITASGTALGDLIGTAAAAAAKGTVGKP